MKIEILEYERNKALKDGYATRRLVLNDLIAFIRAKETAGKKRIELTENMIDDAIVAYCKKLQSAIPEFPIGSDIRAVYETQLEIVKEFCPTMLEDEAQIRTLIVNLAQEHELTFDKAHKNLIMRTIVPVLRQKHVDMEKAMRIINNLII